MRSEFLAFSPPALGEEEIAEVVATLRSDWITTGPRVARFERDFADYVGAPAALAVNSGTSAMHLALVVLGIGAGDAVVTTPMTFCSSVHVIEHTGARPVLVDVDRRTLNIDPDRVEAAVKATKSVRAVLPVHLYGHPVEMDSILEVARSAGLALVEDAAHSLPATYKGRMVGATQGGDDVPDLAAFSFYATKNLTTAEGGMLTGAQDLIDKARVWGLHGMSRDAYQRYTEQGSWFYEVVEAGFKYNMTDIQAALGLQQLKRLAVSQERRRQIFERYDRAFAGIEEVEPPTQLPEVEHAHHLYVLRLKLEMLKIDRARFIAELRDFKIGASVHFIPVHLHPYYRDKYGYKPDDFPVAHGEYLRMVSLPLHPRMTDADVDDVVDAVSTIVDRERR
ncbi:MAG TPA: DegT/DnrJ/EryC1/StrS family aminotransferase [Candidatus Dormibacteraeota bacterium]|nr:DegT/DnrJ/EryC1/StrS family aminotransferase [Candidatus Dormibacteraeota bacterium]